jgi:hypothetical protein
MGSARIASRYAGTGVALQVRVVGALSLLVSAKVPCTAAHGATLLLLTWESSLFVQVQILNVQVPFLFKYIVDELAPSVASDIIVVPVTLLLGCVL